LSYDVVNDDGGEWFCDDALGDDDEWFCDDALGDGGELSYDGGPVGGVLSCDGGLLS